jgi:arginine/ornithine N-succinyltransferase beta subunit
MQNDDIREEIRSARDKQGASPNWDDFINSFIK